MAENKKKAAPKKAVAKKPVVKKATSAAKPAASTTKKTATKKAAPKKAESKKVENKPKTVSGTAKAQKPNPWQIAAIVSGVLIVVLLVAIGAFFLMEGNAKTPVVNNNESTSNTTDVGAISLLIVEDPTCTTCQVDVFADQVKANLIDNLEVKKISIETAEGAAILAELDLNQVPAYLFSKNIDQRADWAEQLAGAFITKNVNGEDMYLLNPQFVPNKVIITEPEILEGAIVYGDENAPVTIYEFSDYECPFCGAAEGSPDMVAVMKQRDPTYVAAMPEVFKNYIETGKVKLVFYNMALESLHPKVRVTHEATLCANEQGQWKEFHDVLFEDRTSWTEEADRAAAMKAYAKELGLDTVAFNTCLDSQKYSAQIDSELAYGASLGVSGTPAFFVGKNFISGAQGYDVFEALIEAELATN